MIRRPRIETEFAAHHGVESGRFESERHCIDVADVECVDHSVWFDVAEQADLAPRRLLDRPVGADHDDLRLDTA